MAWRQMDVAGASGPTLPCKPVAMWHRPVPPYPCPCHQSVGQLLHCLTNIDFMLIQAVDEIHSPWIHGPIVIHLRAINRPCNYHTDQIFTRARLGTTTGSQPRPSLGSPVPKEAPPPLHCLQIPPCSLVL